MNISSSNYSISELVEMLDRRDLTVNEEYQRAPRLWPSGPRSYFIDTILCDFPFPKLYFYEYLDRNRRTKREIVDGQQRVMTINDFVSGKFRLGSTVSRYSGLRFGDLPEEVQERFLGYPVSIDVIRNAETSEILQMFRRMNAYTLPLNEAEKRHSSYFGEFKGFVNSLTDHYAAFLSEWKVLTNRQIVRMADAELFTEMVLALEEGATSSSNKKLSYLYKRYDQSFPHRALYQSHICEALDYIITNLSALRFTYMMKPYALHSLLCALVHNRSGLPSFEAKTGIPVGGFYAADVQAALEGLKALAAAHESNDQSDFKEYVDACSGGSNREVQRTVRVSYMCRALRCEL